MSQEINSEIIKVDEKTVKKLNEIVQRFNKLKSKTVILSLNIKDKISKPLSKITKSISKIDNKKITTIFKADDKITKKLKNITKKVEKLKAKSININVNKKAENGTKQKSLEKVTEFCKNHTADIVNFTKQSVVAAQVQKANESMLASTLKLRTNATKQQINSILKLTSAQQKNGVVSDNVQMAGANQLASYVDNTNSIKSLIPQMNNLLAAQKGVNSTSEDAVGVAELMGQALNGNTDVLAEAGIKFSDAQKNALEYGKEEERVAALSDIISGNVGNANSELAKTDIGAIQKAQILFTDLKEEIGNIILPYLAKFAKWFSDNQPKIKQIVKKIAKNISSMAEKVYEFFMKVTDFINDHQEAILFLITFIGVFATLIGIISMVASIITTITTVISTLTAVQGLFNITLGACPIVWIIAGIALVIAAIVGLIVYWDELKEAAASVWQSITDYFGNLKDSVVGFFTDMVQGIKENWNAIIEFLKNPIKGTIDLIAKKSNDEINSDEEQSVKIKDGNALGTPYWKGGLTYINERGGEIVDLPNGSRVIPADKSKGMFNSGSITFGNIYITAKGVTAKEVVDEIVPQLKLKLANI